MKNKTLPTINTDTNHTFIFIVGSGRCGTTALAQLLSSCTGIAYTPELKYFSYAMASRKMFEPYDSETAIMRFFAHALEKVLKFNPELKNQECEILQRFTTFLQEKPLVGNGSVKIYKTIFLYLTKEFANRPSNVVICQTPNNALYDTLIHNILGNVKYIFMYRDPRNFFASAMKGDRRWFRRDITAITHWNLSMQFGERLCRKYSDDCIFVSQEELLLNQEEILKRLLKFLSLERRGDKETEKQYRSNSSFQAQPLSSSTMERFLYTMNEEEICRVELLTQKYFKKYYPQKNWYVYKSSSNCSRIGKKALLYFVYAGEMIKLKVQIFLRMKGLASMYFSLKRLFTK